MKQQIRIHLMTGFIILISSSLYSQISDYLPIDIMTSKNIFFNRKTFNPSLSNDNYKFQAELLTRKQWLGSNSPLDYNLTCNGMLPDSKVSFGMDFGFVWNNDFENQKIKINYIYKIKINDKNEIKSGINIGVSRFKFIENNISTKYFTEWQYHPIIDIGCTYRRLNQNIGISYQDIVTSRLNSSDLGPRYMNYTLTERLLIINYFSSYNISKNTKFIPEIIFYNNSNISKLFIKSEISFYDNLFTGFMFDYTLNKYSIMISVVIKDGFTIGYIFDYESSIININSWGTHNLKLGILFK